MPAAGGGASGGGQRAAGGIAYELRRATVPRRAGFSSLAGNRAFCARSALGGRPLAALQRAPPAPEVLAQWLRDENLFVETAAACPQAAMWMLLLRLGGILQAAWHREEPSWQDLAEAQSALLRYGLLKEWVQREALPGEPWEAVQGPWPLDSQEAWAAAAYAELLSAGAAGAGALLSGARPAGLNSTAFEAACPLARSAGVLALDGRWHGAAAVLVGPAPESVEGVGNALSRYFHARGLAAVAGAAFAAWGGRGAERNGTFLRYLPRRLGAPAPGEAAGREASGGAAGGGAGEHGPAELRAACAACPRRDQWRWPHTCLGAWRRILPEIRAELRGALRLSGAEALARSRLQPHDVAVHFRCPSKFLGDYALPAFSFYTAAAAAARAGGLPGRRFLLLGGSLSAPCRAAAAALEAFLLERFAGTVERHYTAAVGEAAPSAAGELEAEADFAALVFAPVLLRGPGTFSLWAALARGGQDGEGLVLSAPNPRTSPPSWDWQEADLGPHFRWVRTPLLTSEVISRRGFVFERPAPWVQWLRTH